MSARTLGWALEVALAELTVAPQDAATVALARRYASDLDEASVVSTAAAKLLREVEPWMEPELFGRFAALADRVEQTAVLGQLGPKLLAVLAELGMSPRARADVTRKGGARNAPPTDDPLGKYRAERNKRLNSA